MEDEELFNAWADGDRRAGAKLFKRHYPSILRFFENKAGNAADDLVQRTFTSLVESRERFEGRSSFRTFAFAVAHNVLYNHYRSLRRKAPFDEATDSVADLVPDPSSALVLKRDNRRLLEALRTVPLEHQVVLELFYFERLKAPEIAEVLGEPEGTVRSRLRRARYLVGACLVELGEQPSLATTLTRIDDWADELRRMVWGEAS